MTHRQVSYTVVLVSTPQEFSDKNGRKVSPDNADELREDITQIGQGAYRAVYDLGDHVIKFARCPRGCNSNQNEVSLWETHKDKPTGEMLCPIRAAAPDGSWIIMDRVEPALGQTEAGGFSWDYDYSDSTCEAEEFASMVEDIFELMDVHEGNVGWLDGRLVAVDYAD